MVIFLLFDCLLTVFNDSYTVPIVKNTQNHWCTNRHRSTKTVPRLYQQCTNRQKHSKTVKRQSKQQKWGVKVKGLRLSQKTVKTAEMTIGVPIVTGLPRLYQQCNNSVPIVKNSQNSTKITTGVPVLTCLPRLTNRVPTVYQKQSKDTQNSKSDHCCTNRHSSTKTVPTV